MLALKRLKRSLALLFAISTLLSVSGCAGKDPAEVTIPPGKEENLTFTGTYTSGDKVTVVPYILHCYTDQTLVLECHRNRSGTWSKQSTGDLDLVIDGVQYTAKFTSATASYGFRLNDRLGSEEISLRMTTPINEAEATMVMTDEMVIQDYAGTVRELITKYAERKGEIIFYDASNFVQWETMETDMHGYPVQNKSFGGSNDFCRYHYIKELIYEAKPAILVTINDSNNWTRGQTAEENIEIKQKILEELSQELPDTVVLYLSSTPNPLRYFGSYHDNMVKSDQWLREYAEDHENVVFLDLVPALSLEDGTRVNDTLWKADRLHLNDAGYKILSQLVRSALDQICVDHDIQF